MKTDQVAAVICLLCATSVDCCKTSVITYNLGLLDSMGFEALARDPSIGKPPNRTARRDAIIEQLKRSKNRADVLCLQEVWYGEDVYKITEDLKTLYPYTFSAIHGPGCKGIPDEGYSETPPCPIAEFAMLAACMTEKSCTEQQYLSWIVGCTLLNCLTEVRALPTTCRACLLTTFTDSNFVNVLKSCIAPISPNGTLYRRLNRPGLVLLSSKPLAGSIYDDYHPTTEEVLEKGYLHAKVIGRDDGSSSSSEYSSSSDSDSDESHNDNDEDSQDDINGQSDENSDDASDNNSDDDSRDHSHNDRHDDSQNEKHDNSHINKNDESDAYSDEESHIDSNDDSNIDRDGKNHYKSLHNNKRYRNNESQNDNKFDSHNDNKDDSHDNSFNDSKDYSSDYSHNAGKDDTSDDSHTNSKDDSSDNSKDNSNDDSHNDSKNSSDESHNDSKDDKEQDSYYYSDNYGRKDDTGYDGGFDVVCTHTTDYSSAIYFELGLFATGVTSFVQQGEMEINRLLLDFLEKDKLLLAGDFNTGPGVPGSNIVPVQEEFLDALKKAFDVEVIGQCTLCSAPENVYNGDFGSQMIDHIFYTGFEIESKKRMFDDVMIDGKFPLSDHFGVKNEFRCPNKDKKSHGEKGQKRLNNNIRGY